MRNLRLASAVFFFLFASPAHADTLGEVCQRLVGSEITRCLGAANGRFVNGNALHQCSKLIGSQVTACVGAIADRDYTPSEAQACGSLIGSQVTDCFRGAGHVHQTQQHVMTTSEIKTEISAALGELQAGQATAAAARLQHLLDRLH